MTDKPLLPTAPGSFGEDLQERLKDFDYAVGYLLACLEEGEDVFRLGLRDLFEAIEGYEIKVSWLDEDGTDVLP